MPTGFVVFSVSFIFWGQGSVPIFHEMISSLLRFLFGTAKWKTKLILVKKQRLHFFLNWQVTPSRKGLQSQGN